MRQRRSLVSAARGVLLLCLALPLLSIVPARASDGAAASATLERSVKAAFLYKFLAYVEFPANAFSEPAAPLVIGLIGADEIAAELTRLVAGRTVNAHPLAVRTLRDGDAVSGVHLLFVGGDDGARMRAALKSVAPGTLVVTESDTALQHGSVINFKIIEQRVRFDVSLEAAEKYNLKLSSRLLTVANQVLKGAP